MIVVQLLVHKFENQGAKFCKINNIHISFNWYFLNYNKILFADNMVRVAKYYSQGSRGLRTTLNAPVPS